jgi:tryptophan-rich sensory protein
MRWISLVCWVLVCFSVAGVSSVWTVSEVSGWYRTLARPVIAPPDWVFGPVWSLLYLLMAIAAWLVWELPSSQARTTGITVFLLQLGLNFAWSVLFFRQHAIGGALVEIVLLWASIMATILMFWRVSPVSAWLLLPYLAWVSFATLLNWAFWRLN